MRASDKGHTDVVQPLLSVGAQVDWQDKVRHSISLQNANDYSFSGFSVGCCIERLSVYQLEFGKYLCRRFD